MILVAVVGIAIAGRVADAGRDERTVDARPADIAVGPSAPVRAIVATPSPRSDWPAAIRPRVLPERLPREEGTDGLMGRLPFGFPNDTPTVHVARENRFTIDDHIVAWSGFDTTPPWVRRMGGLANFRTDPYQR